MLAIRETACPCLAMSV